MRVPAAYSTLHTGDAPSTPEQKRDWLAMVDTAILEVSTGQSIYSCNALPQSLRGIYAEAVFGRRNEAGFDTPKWKTLYEEYNRAVRDGASANEWYHHDLVQYRLAALRRFRNIIRRTLPLSSKKRKTKPFWYES